MKNGFTLVELLAIVILLGLIFLVSYPKIVEILEKKNKEIDEVTLNTIYNAADQYIEKDLDNYPKKLGNVYCIKVETLINENLIPLDVTDYSLKIVKVKIGKSSNYSKLVDECET